MPSAHRTIAIDANVLINFIHVGHLGYLAELPGLNPAVPAEAAAEVSAPEQSAALDAALERGLFLPTTVSGTTELTAYADFTQKLGKGESACLAIASARGWSLASDEKRTFRRLALGTLGESRLFTTPDLIIELIRANVITVAEADRWKAMLAERRFRMKFESFSAFF